MTTIQRTIPLLFSLFLLSCNPLSKKDQEAYSILIISGNTFFQMNEMDLATIDFKNALNIDPNGKEALEGLVKIYDHNCASFQQDCALAKKTKEQLNAL